MASAEPDKKDLLKRIRDLEQEIVGLKKQAGDTERGKQESIYRKLFENSSDAIFLIDIATGSYLDANPAAELLTGRSLEEIKKLKTRDITPADYTSRLEKISSHGGPVDHGEIEYIRPDNSRRTALLVSVPIDGKVVFGMARDISERRRDEVLASNRQKILQAILDNVNSIIVVKDPEAHYLLANRKTEEITGKNNSEIIGKTAVDIYPPAIGENIYRDDLEVIGRRKPVTVEETLRLDDGKVYLTTKVPLFDDKGKLLGMCGLATDITERKEYEKQLKESEERFRSMFEEAPLGYQSLDARGKFIAVNKAFVKLLGYEKEELIGKPFRTIVASEYHQAFEKNFCLFKEKGAINGRELELVKKDGTRVMVSIDGRATRDSEGVFRHTHCVLHDMTERRQLEEERSKAAKLESVGILAGGIAHDFNNILTAILGNISMAKQISHREGSSSEELLADAEKSGLRAKGLTQQLLTFSKGGEPVRKPFCIKDILETTTRFSLRGSNVICDFDLPEEPCIVEADEGQIHQLINNIVINADQAMPHGGRLSVKLKMTEVEGGSVLPLDEGRYAWISILDNGPGIARKDLSKIFDPYFTTKRNGSGLGLATCYSIVRKHGGYISADSKLKIGTAFNIYLPASDKQPVEETGPAGNQIFSGRILVMDDEIDVRLVASKMLELIGFDVEVAANGDEAVAAYSEARNSGQPFNAVILDLTVPGGMGGKEAMAELKALDIGVKAIVSSGYSNDPVMSEPERYGFQAVIAKPYRYEELREVVSAVIADI